MRWVTSSHITPDDTISGLAYGPSGLLACSSWDGTVRISSALKHISQAQFSRPVLALAWSPISPILWVCGGESRVSSIDIQSETVCDVFSSESQLLDVAVVSPTMFATVSRSTLNVGDSQDSTKCDLGGGVAVDSDGDNQIVTVSRSQSRVFDRRFLKSAVSEHSLGQGGTPQCVVWLNPAQYAISDSVSQIAVVCPNTPADSYVFKSNRLNNTPRPIYSLTRGPADTTTLASGGGDCSVYVWDYEKRLLLKRAGFPLACTAVVYSTSGDLTVGLSSDEWRNTPAKFTAPARSRVMISHSTALPPTHI